MASYLDSLRVRLAAIGVAAALVALVAALAASGASGRTRSHQPKLLWATINVCRSSSPKLGIRGQMPGDGSHEQMYMRFTAQFHNARGWHPLGGGARSPWERAGSAFNKWQQFGWIFVLNRPAAGTSYLLRGYVEFEWRSRQSGRTVVVRRAHAVTERGHPGTVGAHPRNFSAATCRIKS
jgi:hypothetical protein